MPEITDSCQKAFKQLLKVCAISVPTKGIKKVKRKGVMSGYNCFTKNLYAAEKRSAEAEKRNPISFKQLISMKTWGTLEDKQKTHWHELAQQGCPVIKKMSEE
ncbi:unnamed protein product [marine sediment metagenome]|uniref:Uncharacterized protein n=1 Tax=marine sediment metagenome TaxID=412755 RepID=X1SNA6_9ZZZZ